MDTIHLDNRIVGDWVLATCPFVWLSKRQVRKYWYNRLTNEKIWIDEDLPDGWIRVVNGTGFKNIFSGETYRLMSEIPGMDKIASLKEELARLRDELTELRGPPPRVLRDELVVVVGKALTELSGGEQSLKKMKREQSRENAERACAWKLPDDNTTLKLALKNCDEKLLCAQCPLKSKAGGTMNAREVKPAPTKSFDRCWARSFKKGGFAGRCRKKSLDNPMGYCCLHTEQWNNWGGAQLGDTRIHGPKCLGPATHTPYTDLRDGDWHEDDEGVKCYKRIPHKLQNGDTPPTTHDDRMSDETFALMNPDKHWETWKANGGCVKWKVGPTNEGGKKVPFSQRTYNCVVDGVYKFNIAELDARHQ